MGLNVAYKVSYQKKDGSEHEIEGKIYNAASVLHVRQDLMKRFHLPDIGQHLLHIVCSEFSETGDMKMMAALPPPKASNSMEWMEPWTTKLMPPRHLNILSKEKTFYQLMSGEAVDSPEGNK